MAIFGNRAASNDTPSTDYVTRSEASEVLEQVESLDARVSALESLARQIQGNGGRVPTVQASPADRVQAASTTTRTATATGVDYGAIAFGLSEIKRKLVAAGVASAATLQSEHDGAVQYFADVFAKSDPAFDATEFKRQAGATVPYGRPHHP